MAVAVNKVILVGNLGKDPEIRALESGTKLATFSLATTERYKDSEGNQQERTEWHRIVAWRWLADLAEQYLRKGMKVYLEGKLSTRSYEVEGVQKSITEIVANDIIMMSRGGNAGGGDYVPPSQEPAKVAKNTPVSDDFASKDVGSDVDDLPF